MCHFLSSFLHSNIIFNPQNTQLGHGDLLLFEKNKNLELSNVLNVVSLFVTSLYDILKLRNRNGEVDDPNRALPIRNKLLFRYIEKHIKGLR